MSVTNKSTASEILKHHVDLSPMGVAVSSLSRSDERNFTLQCHVSDSLTIEQLLSLKHYLTKSVDAVIDLKMSQGGDPRL